MDCLAAETKRIGHLLPGPAEIPGSRHLQGFEAVSKLAQGSDSPQAGAGVISRGRVHEHLLGHAVNRS
jgi:hypothetical protein